MLDPECIDGIAFTPCVNIISGPARFMELKSTARAGEKRIKYAEVFILRGLQNTTTFIEHVAFFVPKLTFLVCQDTRV